jgi:hypothetical protein
MDVLPEKLGALLSGVRFLKFKLGSIHAAIHHYECLSENEQNPEMRDWVDLFTIRVGAAARIRGNPSFRSQWWFRSIARKTATLPTRRAISSELHTLKVGVIDQTEQQRRHKIDVTLPAKAKHGDVVDPRLSALNQDIDRLVGLARPVEEVTKMVTESGDKSELKTVSIVGMVGSGKMTLAYAVYMRLREENCFQCHAFVSVEQNLEVKKTLMDMLSMLADGPRVRPLLESAMVPSASVCAECKLSDTRYRPLSTECARQTVAALGNVRLYRVLFSKHSAH